MVSGFKKSAQAGGKGGGANLQSAGFVYMLSQRQMSIYQAVYWNRNFVSQSIETWYFLLLTQNAVNCQSGKNESTYLGLKEVHREVLSDI